MLQSSGTRTTTVDSDGADVELLVDLVGGFMKVVGGVKENPLTENSLWV